MPSTLARRRVLGSVMRANIASWSSPPCWQPVAGARGVILLNLYGRARRRALFELPTGGHTQRCVEEAHQYLIDSQTAIEYTEE
jgi:hypothetical protein